MSPQDLLAHSNGLFGGIHISNSVGNTGTGGANIISGNLGLLVVHSATTLSANTSTNIANLTGVSLVAGNYGGRHTTIQVSGGDLTAYYLPTLSPQ